MKKFLALCLIALFLFGTVVRADDGEDEDSADSNERELEVETEDGEYIEFWSSDAALGNSIRFLAEQNSEGIFVQVEFVKEYNDDENGGSDDDGSDGSRGEDVAPNKRSDGSDDDPESNDVVVRFSALFEAVIFYTETNGQAGYQSGEDSGESIYSLAEVDFGNFSCDAEVLNGVNGYNCVASSSLFGISIYLVEASTTVSGLEINPTSTKLDVFLYKDDSRNVALIVGFQGEENEDGDDTPDEIDPEVEDDDDEDATASNKQTVNERQLTFGDHGFFSWVQTATINGVSVNVLNGDIVYDGSSLHEIVYSFETSQVGELTWDPVLAVKGTTKLSSDAGALVPLFGVIIAVLALVF